MTHSTLDNRWNTYLSGSGALERVDGALRFLNVDTTTRRMTNAQIDDYQGLRRRQYRWRPPLTLTVRARFSHPREILSGTAGFGFWNDPFLMTGWRTPALPRALWFFYASPPSDMHLAQDVPGRGWKAAAIDATRLRALLWAPLAPILVPLMNVRPIYRRLWPHIQRSLGINEAQIEVGMQDWHTYRLEWQVDRARFSVNGMSVLDCAAPRGPLGFVAWLDNQYMVVTPWGRFGYGWLEAPGEQWMEIEGLEIAGLRHTCTAPQRGASVPASPHSSERCAEAGIQGPRNELVQRMECEFLTRADTWVRPYEGTLAPRRRHRTAERGRCAEQV